MPYRLWPLPRVLLLLVALVALAGGCSRPAPSPEYAEAQDRWLKLVQRLGDDAAGDPGADAVLGLLSKVPPQSADAPAAAELRGRIEAARKAAAEDEARRAKLVEAAGRPGAWTGPADAPGGAAPAAPAPVGPPIALGMKQEEFAAAYGACFDDLGPVQLEDPARGGAARPGRMFGLKQEQACQARHVALLDKRLVFVDGALASVSAISTTVVERKRQTVELGKLPDGTTGMVVDGKVVPLPEGAVVEEVKPPAEGTKP